MTLFEPSVRPVCIEFRRVRNSETSSNTHRKEKRERDKGRDREEEKKGKKGKEKRKRDEGPRTRVYYFQASLGYVENLQEK